MEEQTLTDSAGSSLKHASSRTSGEERPPEDVVQDDAAAVVWGLRVLTAVAVLLLLTVTTATVLRFDPWPLGGAAEQAEPDAQATSETSMPARRRSPARGEASATDAGAPGALEANGSAAAGVMRENDPSAQQPQPARLDVPRPARVPARSEPSPDPNADPS